MCGTCKKHNPVEKEAREVRHVTNARTNIGHEAIEDVGGHVSSRSNHNLVMGHIFQKPRR